mgnify:CR=1 FL=1
MEFLYQANWRKIKVEANQNMEVTKMESGVIQCAKHGRNMKIVDGRMYCAQCQQNRNRRERHQAMLDLGLNRVRGSLGGVYYE